MSIQKPKIVGFLYLFADKFYMGRVEFADTFYMRRVDNGRVYIPPALYNLVKGNKAVAYVTTLFPPGVNELIKGLYIDPGLKGVALWLYPDIQELRAHLNDPSRPCDPLTRAWENAVFKAMTDYIIPIEQNRRPPRVTIPRELLALAGINPIGGLGVLLTPRGMVKEVFESMSGHPFMELYSLEIWEILMGKKQQIQPP